MSAADTAQYIVKCDCGFEARGDRDAVVAAMQNHAEKVHNMRATAEQVMERAVPLDD